MESYDLIVIGGGASGICAAIEAHNEGVKKILVIDREEHLGGVLNELIETGHGMMSNGVTGVGIAEELKDAVDLEGITLKRNTLVLDVLKDKTIKYVSAEEGVRSVEGKSIIFATGARERPRGELNISSNKSAGIMSVGSARKLMVHSGYLPGKNIVIYSLDLNTIYLSKRLMVEGAKSVVIVEPGKTYKDTYGHLESLDFYEAIEIRYNTKITQVTQNGRIEGVTLKNQEGEEEFLSCDSLLLSVGLDPSKRLFKKFRRGMNEKGMYVVGNAEEVTYDLEMVMNKGKAIGKESAKYLKALERELTDLSNS